MDSDQSRLCYSKPGPTLAQTDDYHSYGVTRIPTDSSWPQPSGSLPPGSTGWLTCPGLPQFSQESVPVRLQPDGGPQPHPQDLRPLRAKGPGLPVTEPGGPGPAGHRSPWRPQPSPAGPPSALPAPPGTARPPERPAPACRTPAPGAAAPADRPDAPPPPPSASPVPAAAPPRTASAPPGRRHRQACLGTPDLQAQGLQHPLGGHPCRVISLDQPGAPPPAPVDPAAGQRLRRRRGLHAEGASQPLRIHRWSCRRRRRAPARSHSSTPPRPGRPPDRPDPPPRRSA